MSSDQKVEQKIDVAGIARMSLLEMDKDKVSPSPENYKKYFEIISIMNKFSSKI